MNIRELDIPVKTVDRYIQSLINQFFKILPLKESGELSLPVYLKSLQREIAGLNKLVDGLGYDKYIIQLLAILQYMIDDDPDVKIVKSEVFKAINICKKILVRSDDYEYLG